MQKSTMYFVKLFSCTLLALLLCTQDTKAEQSYCGPALYDVLDNICKNSFQKLLLPTKKRSELPHYGLAGGESNNDILPLPYDGGAMLMDKIYGDMQIANIMAKTRRRRHGIFDECCRKGCTFNELATYCS